MSTISNKLKNERITNIFILTLRNLFSKFHGTLLSLRVIYCGASPKVSMGCFIEGGKHISIGDNFIAGHGLRLQAIVNHSNYTFLPTLKIGSNVNFNDSVHIGCAFSIKIGDGCLVGSKVIITDHNHDVMPIKLAPIMRNISGGEIVIKENVWIGDNVVILPGVTVGVGAVIAANSVVNKDIPDAAIAAGVPVVVKRLVTDD